VRTSEISPDEVDIGSTDPDELINQLIFGSRFTRDPYPVYAELRARSPIHRSSLGPVWIVTRYDDCHALLRDPRLGKRPTDLRRLLRGDIAGASAALPEVVTRGSMVFMNPPEHTRIRGFLNRTFTPRRVAELRPFVESVTNGLLDAMTENNEVDLVDDLAFRIPVDVIAELVGVPRSDRAELQSLVATAVRIYDPATPDEELQSGEQAARALTSHFARLERRYRRSPADNLLSSLITARENDDRLDRAELLSTITLLFGAGFESTAYIVSTGLHTLLHRPDLRERLRNEPGLLPGFVEEALRHESVFQLVFRSVLQPFEWEGNRFEAGDWVLVMLGSANRDPSEFSDPDTFDPTRDPNHHLSFSSGVHHCLGANLARLEADVAFGAVLNRFPDAHLVGDEPRWRVIPFRGIDHLNVRLR